MNKRVIKEADIQFLQAMQVEQSSMRRSIANFFLALYATIDSSLAKPTDREKEQIVLVCNEIKNRTYVDISEETFKGHFATESTLVSVARNWKKQYKVLDSSVLVTDILHALLDSVDAEETKRLNSFFDDCVSYLRKMQQYGRELAPPVRELTY